MTHFSIQEKKKKKTALKQGVGIHSHFPLTEDFTTCGGCSQSCWDGLWPGKRSQNGYRTICGDFDVSFYGGPCYFIVLYGD